MTSLSLGVHVGQQNATMAELVALWTRLDETVGWISVWDHLYEAPPAGRTTPHSEAVATLGALASVTERARIGCLMFCVPYRTSRTRRAMSEPTSYAYVRSSLA